MSQLMEQKPTTVFMPTGAHVLDTPHGGDIGEKLKSLGAQNIEPPRPRSSHLKIIATGRVLPWEEILAEQTTLVVNCDASGNTDPEAWLPTVAQEFDPNEHMEQIAIAQAKVLEQAAEAADKHRVNNAVDPEPQSGTYPYGAVPVSDIEDLLKQLDG